MDISAQLRSYHTFMIGLRYVVLATVASVSLLITVFCTALGWSGGLLVTFIELLVGLNFAKERNETSWQSGVAGLMITTEAESGQPTANQARAGIRRGTFAMLAVLAVLVSIGVGAASALFPHSR
jgi:hypothetical protein